MKKPIIVQKHPYGGKIYIVEFFEITNKLPDLPWVQIYAIGNLDGKVPVVKYPDDFEYPRGLPGGHPDVGESIDETLFREVREELNMRVLSWYPLGYEKIIDPEDSSVEYKLRAYAKLEKMDEFIGDPDGYVIGYEMLDLNDVPLSIEWYERGEWLIDRVRKEFE